MNRIWIAVLLLTFTVHRSYAQKMDFMDTSNKWRVSNLSVIPNYTKVTYWNYRYLNYTQTVKGIEYRIITGGYDTIFVRKDSITGVIYAMTPAYPQNDSMDRLLYDFKMNKGDTYTHYIRTYDNINKQFVFDTTRYKVLETDSVLINGVSHRIQYISSAGTIFKYRYVFTVIEGIGSISGMMWPLHYSHPWYINETTDCFYNSNGTPIPALPVIAKSFHTDTTSSYYALDTFDNSCPPKLAIPQTKSDDNRVTIYPQPAKNHVVIDLGTIITDGSIYITNIQGQVVLMNTITNRQQIRLQLDHPQGIYIYKITDLQRGTQYSGKILIE